LQVRAGHAEVEQIFAHELAQLWMRLPGRAATDRKHGLDAVVEQTLPQDALPHHSRRAEEDDLHVVTTISYESGPLPPFGGEQRSDAHAYLVADTPDFLQRLPLGV